MMHRIDSANARPNANGVGKTGYHLNTDLFGVEPTSLTPDALNAIQEEICIVIEETGAVLVKGTNNQLLLAIQRVSVDATWRVGMVVEFATDEDPNDTWPWSTWVRFAEGKTTVGQLDGDDDFGAIGDTGGKKGHKMTEENLIEHAHATDWETYNEDGSAPNHMGSGGAAGDSEFTLSTEPAGLADPEPIPTLMPFVVTAKWRRTA